MDNTVGKFANLFALSSQIISLCFSAHLPTEERRKNSAKRKIREKLDERITACSHKYKTQTGEKERASKGEKIEPNSLILNYYLSIMESEWSPGAAQQQRIRKDLWALRGPVLPSAACSAPRGCRGAAASACLIIYP